MEDLNLYTTKSSVQLSYTRWGRIQKKKYNYKPQSETYLVRWYVVGILTNSWWKLEWEWTWDKSRNPAFSLETSEKTLPKLLHVHRVWSPTLFLSFFFLGGGGAERAGMFTPVPVTTKNSSEFQQRIPNKISTSPVSTSHPQVARTNSATPCFSTIFPIYLITAILSTVR